MSDDAKWVISLTTPLIIGLILAVVHLIRRIDKHAERIGSCERHHQRFISDNFNPMFRDHVEMQKALLKAGILNGK